MSLRSNGAAVIDADHRTVRQVAGDAIATTGRALPNLGRPGVAAPVDLAPTWPVRRTRTLRLDPVLLAAGACGAALYVLALVAPNHPVELSWVVPGIDLLMIAVLAMVAVLGGLDAVLRRHGRSIPITAAATAIALVWVPHLLTFPGVVPGGLPGVGPQTAAILGSLAHIATPAALAIALVLAPGPLRRPGRTLAGVLAAASAATLLVVLGLVLVAPALPAAVSGGRFTTFTKVLIYAALVPAGVAFAAYLSGRRGDERVSGSVAAALVLLVFGTLTDAIVPGRYVVSFYVANVLRLAPAVVLLVGQLSLYARTVRARDSEEQARRDSEAHTRSVIAAASDAFIEADDDGRIMSWNPRAEALFGWSADDVIGRMVADTLIPARYRAEHNELARRALAGEGPLAGGEPIGLTLLRHDGTEIAVEVSVSAVGGPTGTTFAAFVRDITERRSFERQLAASEAQFRLAQHHAPIGLALVGLDGSWLQVNPAVCRIVGRSEAELRALTFQDLTHPDDLDADLSLVSKLLAGEITDYRMDKRYLRPDGSVVWAQLNVSLVRDPDGVPQHFISQIQDITERRLSEDRLRMQQEIVATMGEGVVLSGLDTGTILFTNPQVDAMYGYDSGELIGRPIALLNAPGARTPERISTDIAESLRRDGHWSGTLESVRKDGSRFWRRSVVSMVDLQEWGSVAVSVQSDITPERTAATLLHAHADALGRANQELARSNADLEQFASVAAHDLKSPLTTIGGFASLLQDGHGGDLSEDGRQFAGFVVKGVDRLQRIVDDLLDFARLGTTAELQHLDIAATVGEVLALLAGDIATSGTEVEVGALPWITGDRGQIRQLFMNLVSNAIKFRRPDAGSRVAISAEQVGASWEFTVADDGIGIDPQFRERVFKLFQRLHTADEFPGTGIGLAICKRVIDNHDGRIWIEDNAGRGTAFRFTLPATAQGRA